ncbi:DUF2786 domain-containing protein [Acuticoccus kandeliae]|uniref:DUF2786 domain-containing protein n=1 Tax=Acuticoccus kandeliae TaxID=2073160 RepID=UPI000D3EB6EF|nr:DUF2786 domain-containing protein [Acuticoccus kandeliae]
MTASAQVIVLNDEQIIRAGQRAWTEEKLNQQRALHRWHEIGKALLVGRGSGESQKKTKAFGVWCKEHGFDDIKSTVRSDAIWLAENWDEVRRLLHGVQQTHPTHIRSAYRKAKAGPAIDTSKLTDIEADTIRKLDRLATHPDTPAAEAAIAAAKRDEMLDRFNVDIDEMRESAEANEAEDNDRADIRNRLESIAIRLEQKPAKWLVDRLLAAAVKDWDLLVSLQKEL